MAVPHLNVQTRDGSSHSVEYRGFETAMEVIRNSSFDEMLALCGGACSCATCHVHVAPTDWDRLPPVGEDESDLLDTSPHRTKYSRLSCQIALNPDLDGISMVIAQED